MIQSRIAFAPKYRRPAIYRQIKKDAGQILRKLCEQKGVEIIETVKPDTQFLNDRQRMLITQEYVITSFDSALYYLPPILVTVDGKEYKSKALALKVYSIPVDTLHPDQFFGQKPVMKAPFAWEDLSLIHI